MDALAYIFYGGGGMSAVIDLLVFVLVCCVLVWCIKMIMGK
jgi:hypothetical protein